MAISTAHMPKQKLHGRAFYESIGSPKLVLAPMVDQSEFAWRMLSRSFMKSKSSTNFLAYSPMLHARLFADSPKYRAQHFNPIHSEQLTPLDASPQPQISPSDPYLDGNPSFDRPLFVQFCANDPDAFLEAARHVQPYCDAVDLNLGCPQGIAKRGQYGAFLQEDWDLIYRLINKLHKELDIPVTAKMRILDTKEKTLEYAKMILSAGASIITVHGRRREQKGHNTGLADWSVLAYLRKNLPPKTVIFANGNILQHGDIQRCLDETGVDGVMSAEGNLFDPTIFSEPPAVGDESVEYWRGRDGRGGYRMDAVMRRYLDIIHRYVLREEPPARTPLFDPAHSQTEAMESECEADDTEIDQPPHKKRKKQDDQPILPVDITAIQSHLFNMLRALVTEHTDIRDALAKCRAGDIKAFERVLSMVERAVRRGLIEYHKNPDSTEELIEPSSDDEVPAFTSNTEYGSAAVIARCKRPWWICQPHIRPSPEEALQKGALQLSKKDKRRLEEKLKQEKEATSPLEGATKVIPMKSDPTEKVTVPTEGLVCG